MKNEIPEYQRIYYELREQIVRGTFRLGERLPSRRTLAEREGVSVITVSHAYDLLCEEGYAEPRERSGYFVVFDDSDPFLSEGTFVKSASARGLQTHDSASSRGQKLPKNTENTSTLKSAFVRGQRNPASAESSVKTSYLSDVSASSESAGFPPGGMEQPEGNFRHLAPVDPLPFQTYARIVRRVLSSEGDKLFLKSENTGRYDLRLAIASYLARNRGINVLPEQIVIGSGAEYLYGIVVYMLGRDIIYGIEDPSYETIEKVYRRNGAVIEKLKMGSDGIESQSLINSKARVLHVTPYHSFPSFVTASATKRYEYINWAKSRDGIIVEDDYDSEFSLSGKPNSTLFSMEPLRHVIYINTFSRTISRGTRIGYMILPSESYKDLLDKIDFFSCTVPVLDQAVLREILNSGAFERHINRMRRRIRGDTRKRD